MTNRSTDIGASGVTSIASEERYRPYSAYKDSGVEWLEEIPAHWEMKRVNQISEILRGKFAHRPRNDPSLYDGPYPFVQTGDVTRARKEITSYRQTLNERGLGVSKMFPSGTLVMTIAANIGDVAVLDFEACFPDSVVGFIPRCGIERDFLFYVFLAMKPELLREAPVNTQGNLNIERIGSIGSPIPMPGESEQRAIAAFLDRETAKIDALVAKKERLIELLQEKRTALISHAVTKGLDPDVPLKDSGIEWLGKIPAHWEVKQLRWAITFQRGHDLPSDDREEGDVPVVSSSGISSMHSKAVAKAPGIVTGRCGTIGQFYLINQSYWPLNTALYSIDLHGNEPSFLLYMLIHMSPLFFLHSIKSAVPAVDRKDVHEDHTAVPHLSEQRAIAAFLDRETAQIDALVAKVQEAINHLKELRTAFISAAVTGKIDVREAAA